MRSAAVWVFLGRIRRYTAATAVERKSFSTNTLPCDGGVRCKGGDGGGNIGGGGCGDTCGDERI